MTDCDKDCWNCGLDGCPNTLKFSDEFDKEVRYERLDPRGKKRCKYNREYSKTEKYKECQKKYRSTEKWKATQKRYYESEKGKESHRKYEKSEKCQAKRRKYRQSERGREANRICCKRYYEKHREEILERQRERRRLKKEVS